MNFGQQYMNYFQQQPQQMPMQQLPMLYGKIVDGIDVVKSMDIPLGVSFILPQANGNIIYSKGWNQDGTTYIKEYKIVEQQVEKQEDKLSDIYEILDELNKKLDKIKVSSSPINSSMKRKKVGDEDE